MNKIHVGHRITWIIGADEHDTTGPTRKGTVYAAFPKGTAPYWEPFLMAKMEREEPESIDSLLNGPQRMAVMLDNPTLRLTDD